MMSSGGRCALARTAPDVASSPRLAPDGHGYPETRRSLERSMQRWLQFRQGDGYGSLAAIRASARGAA
jgi:hypothetical protein